MTSRERFDRNVELARRCMSDATLDHLSVHIEAGLRFKAFHGGKDVCDLTPNEIDQEIDELLAKSS